MGIVIIRQVSLVRIQNWHLSILIFGECILPKPIIAECYLDCMHVTFQACQLSARLVYSRVFVGV